MIGCSVANDQEWPFHRSVISAMSDESTKCPDSIEFDQRWQNGRHGQDTIIRGDPPAKNCDHQSDQPRDGNAVSKSESEDEEVWTLKGRKKLKPSRQTFGIEGNNSSMKITLDPIAKVLGTNNVNSTFILAKQVADITMVDGGRDILNFRSAIATIDGIGPKDELERLLAVQMIAVHHLATECLKRAADEDQTLEELNTKVNLATKLLRTFTTQMEALNRHRGKVSQMIVGNVTVSEGAQAIVGSVSKESKDGFRKRTTGETDLEEPSEENRADKLD
jgi:hypothetical protein